MKTIRADLPRELDRIEIHPLADLHIGDSCCNYLDIRKELDYIRDTDGVYCVLDGDLMDTAIASSVGDTYGANLQPMEQLNECVKLFEPIKHKILAVVGGNHESRIYKSDGIDMTSLFCDQLGIGDKYSSTTAIIYVRFGTMAKHNNRRQCYSVYMTHGTGGGRREGGKIQRLADLAGIVDSDIYLMAHVHQPAAFRSTFYRADAHNSTAQKVEHLFVNTAAWLDYGGYGDRNGYKPASSINPVIVLEGAHKSMKALI